MSLKLNKVYQTGCGWVFLNGVAITSRCSGFLIRFT
ncbi:hypothetical protein MetMK1DRAFT_00012200 [Metallosphaera yellowstonensis MK1]|uniref:Uncharacterized protein n=1 Tax=Metallosphaera yellowstonensis MK1 TaxID=671065 RepID=H2C396_9CREN|nr:hypothetical protein MetMK1DRAFT_00012200 [Metallosphaera yellowstonensis MK1]